MRHKELEKAVLAVMLGKQVDEAKKPLHPNQQKLDVHEPEKDELTAKDFEMLRAGKKAKQMKEEEQIDELKKSTLASYAKKATVNAVQKTQDAGAEAEYGSPSKSNELEKKAEKRVAGVNKAVTRLAKEEVELDDNADETVFIHTPVEYEVKESYNFGEYLSAAKNLVGEEEAINLANEKFNSQDVSIFAEQFMRSDIEDKVKTHEKAGHKVSTPKYMTKSGKPYAEYVVTDKESGVRRKYIHHGNARSVENMGAVGKKDE